MKKQVKKWLTLIMAFALILGSVRYSPLSASATEVSDPEYVDTASGGDSGESGTTDGEGVTENIDTVSGDIVFGPQKVQMLSMARNARAASTTRYYTFNDITKTGGYGNTASVTSEGALEISYNGQYQEIQYGSLPAGVDGKTLESITFKVSGGDVSGLAIKVFVDGQAGTDVIYGSDTISITQDLSSATTVGFALMNNASAAADYVIDYFSITAEQTGGSEQPPTASTTRYYTFNDITKTGGYGNTANVTSAGALEISYNGQYQEIQYGSLPAGVDGKTLESITFKVSGGDVSGLAIKVFVDGQAGTDVIYGSDTISITQDLSSATTVGFALMNNASAAADYVIDYFSITAEQTGGSEQPPTAVATTRYYTFNDITKTGGYGNTANVTSAGALEISYTGQYSEIQYGSLPAGVDGKTLEKITFKVSGGDASNLAIKVLKDGSQAQVEYGKETITITADTLSDLATASAIGFALMNNASVAADYVIDYFSITAVQTGGLENPPEDIEPVETYTITIYPSSLTKDWGNAASDELAADNRWHISFGGQNNEVRLNLPVTINMAECESITFNVKDQVEPLNFAISSGGTKKGNYYYNTGNTSYVLTADKMNENPAYSGDVDAVNLQQGTANDTSVTLDSIVFTMKKTADQQDAVYGDEPTDEPIDLTVNVTPEATSDSDRRFTIKDGGLVAQASADVTCTPKETEKVELSFIGTGYQEIQFTLPEVIDLAYARSVTFAVSDQTVPLCFKLYDIDGNEISSVTAYKQNGSYTMTNVGGRTEKVASIAVMLHADNANEDTKTCLFDGVLFKMNDPDEKTHEVTFGGSDLEVLKSEGDTTYTVGADGQYTLSFPALNAGVSFKIPKIINMANCVNIQFTVSGQTGKVNYYLQMDGLDKDYKYNLEPDQPVHTMTSQLTEGGINGIKVQCAGQEYVANSGITLEKITFTMKGEDGTNDFLKEEDANPEPTPVPADKENITPVKAESKRVLAGDLKIAHANVTEYNKTTNDQIQITFNGAWSELKLKLPEAVNMLQCKGVTFAVSEQTVPLSLKLYKEGDLDNPVSAWYHEQNENGIYAYDVSSAETITHIGIMLHSDDVAAARAAAANYCVFDGVVFDMDTTISTETHTVTVPANELTLKTSEASSCNLQNGNWMIKFSNMDQKVNFTLPEIVNLEKCVNIIVTVAGQNGPMNFYVGMDSVQQGSVYNYNTGKTEYVLEPNAAAKINEFGIQCGRDNGTTYVPDSFLELVSVSFLMRGPEPEETPADNVYSAGKLFTTAKDADVTQETDANGVTTITFPKKDNSITYEVPDAIATNHMTSIQFLPSLSGVKVELLNARGKVLMEGTESILATNCNPEVKYIRLVSLADNTELTLDGIKFNVDPDAFEAIVLNGRFEREDLSMWNGIGTWGNATITARTSDTEIVEGTGIYTYAEITGRESPYHCFAQDVSDRTEHQTGYNFSFWAKLSDDYKDAPPELRTVSFSPYYIDANGKTNYNMYSLGSYKVLEPGVWTHFSGVVNLPSGAQGFIIRIVEQGTDYGQGRCVLGSYAVTDVVLTPTEMVPEPSYNWGGGGNRSHTVTKEATCEVAYELKDLSIDWASAKATAQKTGMQAEFTNNYDEVRLKLPRTLDMSTCAYIKLNVPAQNVPIALKLYRKGKQVDVAYYNDITGSYLMVPEYDGMIDAIGIMSLSTPNPAGAFALADLITFGLTQEPAPEEVSNDIVINGYFTDEDLSDWSAALWGDGVKITQHTADKPIFGDTYTYATYSRRTSPYQCFAQDITGRVQQNETYTFSFWAKLSNDYKGAPENQRVVQFAPYTVDKNGKEDYNPRLDGVYSQVLEPGVWTYFEGTYKVTNDNPISKVVIRILEQGTKYGQGDCVMGSYSVAGVRMARYIPEPPSIDEDVPNLKDAMAEVFGDDFIMGTAVTVNEMEDLGIEMLVNKHFNAVTIGNELKPDALFNYSNDAHTPLQTITFNGEKLEVPTLYFGRAEEILDTLKKWNESHPDQDPIKVRGHVLVWHSQTPEWFFREGYTVKQNADGSENYVTPEVMNQRLEWYIKTVLEHFTGEDSPYRDMFYGWDVVNEAVSNGGNGYRTEKASAVEPLSQSTHSANSSWWAVYQSNEFILNAFRYANQYAPADVELYYNDYNECDSKKVAGIVKLLSDVKEADGTRIDGMGMQGHYNMFNPYMADIERAIRAYSEVVDKVMYTEFDMKVSGDISQDEAREKEYMAQAERYHDIYVLLKNLNAEEGINIAGFTVWGTVDKYSWLQGNSDVGGGADGTLTQCPLLFDYDYKVKPSYWAFVDYTMVDPDWTEEAAVEEEEEPKPEESETPETDDAPETQPEAEPVVEPSPVVEEQKKNNPALVVGLAVGAVVLGAGAGAGFYFFKKKKKITK